MVKCILRDVYFSASPVQWVVHKKMQANSELRAKPTRFYLYKYLPSIFYGQRSVFILRIGSKSQRNRDGIVTIIWSVEQEKIMKWDS